MSRSVLFFHILLGILFGVWISTNKGISLLEPSPLPSEWSVRAPAQDEFEGTPQVGQGISVRAGRLLLYRQQLYASDVLYRNDIPPQGTFSITLAPDSGLMALGFVGETTEYLFLSPQKLYQDTLDEPGIASTSGRYSFSMTDTGVFIEPKHIQITENTINAIELMTAAQQSSITALSFAQKDGQILFKENFSEQDRPSYFLTAILALMGGTLGACISLSYGTTISYGIRLILGLSPLIICLGISHHAWLNLGIRMYLVETPVWLLERWVLAFAYILSGSYFAMHGKIWCIQTKHTEKTLPFVWMLFSLLLIGTCFSLSIWSAVYALLFLYMPVLLGELYRKRSILIFEILLMGLSLVWNLPFSFLCILCFRWIVLFSNLKTLFQSQSNRAAEYTFLLLLCIPLQLEHSIRSSYLNRVWSEETLGGKQQENLRGLPKTWSETCEGRGSMKEQTIIVSGGSSTGGIYQFKEEPTSFFTTHLHNSICQNNLSFKTMTTYNYGVEDYNTQLIADQGQWLKEKHSPDILILYVGVNDVLSKHHTQSIRERRKNSVSPWLKNLLYKSKLSTGISLLLQEDQKQSDELVAEVPVSDAKENILSLMNDLSPISILLVPEMASSPLQPQLLEYDSMIQDLAKTYPNIYYFQPLTDRNDSDIHLADRNHLTREGNQWLGQEVANAVLPLLTKTKSSIRE
ncbi:MAG: hypothetical protein CL916_09235 [Deltaproteobacteria bacterium]|nr:hypothetical protein [Deltaproteobacteria bacterium]